MADKTGVRNYIGRGERLHAKKIMLFIFIVYSYA